jgi:DNA-binding response OmpR family regulator
MSRGVVLVIEDDQWVACLLEGAIREAGYDVTVCATALAGLEEATTVNPECIICDVDLPDNDGYSVARSVRTHPSSVSVTPFLFLSGLDDAESRIAGFHVGADVYITKPFRIDEVVAQVNALVQMAARLRRRRDSLRSLPPGATPPAIDGDLGQMSIATVLTVLEMERRCGTFRVTSKRRRAFLEIASGAVTCGVVGSTNVPPLTALRTMLAWSVGRFSFTPEANGTAPPPGAKSLGALLVEAMRLADEERHAGLELPSSKRREGELKISAPALGGPASSPADFAPPSSRTPELARSSDLALAFELEPSDWETHDDDSPSAPSVVVPCKSEMRASSAPPRPLIHDVHVPSAALDHRTPPRPPARPPLSPKPDLASGWPPTVPLAGAGAGAIREVRRAGGSPPGPPPKPVPRPDAGIKKR